MCIEEMSSEIESFKSLLAKSRAIITTNYDAFSEQDLLEGKYSVFSDQSDIFSLNQIVEMFIKSMARLRIQTVL